MRRRLTELLASRWIVAVAIGLALAVAMPSIRFGWAADDYWQRVAFAPRGDLAFIKKSWWDLFAFFDGDAERVRRIADVGATPWWSDGRMFARFFRPLSSFTHALDYTYWPERPAFMHAQSVLWYAALGGAAAWTYRRLLGATWVAGAAAIFYALDHTHGIPVGWLSGRNAMVSAVFAIAALGAHDVAVKERSRAWTAISTLLLALGIAGGEGALAILAYLGAYALFLDPRPARARVLSLAPQAILAGAFLLSYHRLGFGVGYSGMYVEPMRDPGAFLANAAQSLPLLFGTELGAPSPDVYAFFPLEVKAAMMGLAIGFMLWAAPALARLWRVDPRARFAVLGSLVGTLPGCATFPSARLTLVSGFGVVMLVAMAAAALAAPKGPAPASKVARGWVYYATFGHAFLSPLVLVASVQSMALFDTITRRLAADLPNRGAEQAERVVLLNAPDSVFVAYVIGVAKLSGPAPGKLLSLAAGQRALHVTRDGETSLRVRQDDGFIRLGTELLTRSPRETIPVGTVFQFSDYSVEILHATADAVPDEVRFTFDQPLESPALSFRRWENGHLVAITPPAEGTTIDVAAHMIDLR